MTFPVCRPAPMPLLLLHLRPRPHARRRRRLLVRCARCRLEAPDRLLFLAALPRPRRDLAALLSLVLAARHRLNCASPRLLALLGLPAVDHRRHQHLHLVLLRKRTRPRRWVRLAQEDRLQDHPPGPRRSTRSRLCSRAGRRRAVQPLRALLRRERRISGPATCVPRPGQTPLRERQPADPCPFPGLLYSGRRARAVVMG